MDDIKTVVEEQKIIVFVTYELRDKYGFQPIDALIRRTFGNYLQFSEESAEDDGIYYTYVELAVWGEEENVEGLPEDG